MAADSIPQKKQLIDRIIPSLLAEIDPAVLLQKRIQIRKNCISWNGGNYSLAPNRSVYVVGAGKGAARMAIALEEILGDAVSDGVVVTKYGYGLSCKAIRVIEAGHPVPDRPGGEGAREILRLARLASGGDLLIGLWSGGGSALLPLPQPGMTLAQKRRTTDLLLRSGATIAEINTVRKHLSQIKGGRLAEAAAPARMVNFILSDVVEDRLDVVASGPTVPDPSRFLEAIEILKRYQLWTKVDSPIRQILEQGNRGQREETPKPGDPLWRQVDNLLIGNGQLAVQRAAHQIAAIGYRPKILTSALVGEAKEVAKVLAALAKEEKRRKRRGGKPLCLLAGGETTVTVKGGGLGGRCQEFALSAAMSISGVRGITVAAFCTDGTDGPTDAAGAIADGRTARRAEGSGHDPQRFLDENDSYRFFNFLGDLIRTGPTRNHLNDLYLIFIS